MDEIRARLDRIESATDGYYGHLAVNALRAVLSEIADLGANYGDGPFSGSYIETAIRRVIAEALVISDG